jgi:hypothetical protein
MARQLSAKEEAELAAWAERTRDDESVWDFSNPVELVEPVDSEVVISIRLRSEEFRVLKKKAESRGASVPQIVQEKLAELTNGA